MRQTYASFRSHLASLPPNKRRAALVGLSACALLVLTVLAGTVYLWKLARQFPRAPFAQPSRLYTRVPEIAPGDTLSRADLLDLLAAADYREARDGEALLPGTYKQDGDRTAIALRRFPTPHGERGGVPVEIQFAGDKVAKVREGSRDSASVLLEPPLLASFYTPEMEERRPVTLDELPEHVVQTVLAAEDDAFFAHPGVSVPGIVRALWANLQDGEVQQGGSTITQQLVKNVYLSHERTLSRKAKEALIAMMLEVRYGKRAILEAYLNEIYLGKSGPANVLGIGAAARAYFGKEASSLTLEEAAVIAGMIKSPAQYMPTENPDAAIDRRNQVLQRMGELEWVEPARVRRAWTAPLVLAPQTVRARRHAPYFANHAAAEARERFGLKALAGEGYLLFSTLQWRDQRAAEKAVKEGLDRIERGPERRSKTDEPLQAALVSVDPRTGAILAYVGGRDYDKSEFDRVSQARRQAGSAFKPVIYAAAFSEGIASPSSLLKDSPIVVKVDNQDWRPQNYDRRFHGMVTVRTALEQSLNIPTIRLSLQVGLWRVIDLAHELGVEGELEPVPALALGAFEMTPWDMAQVYSTLASNGLRPDLHGLDAVLAPSHEPLEGEEEEKPKRVLQPHAAFLVTSMLQGVLDKGTGAGYGGRGSLAGKTGTTNDRRDNWFAGYSPDRVTVVWVGYDDNSRTRLSGATAALPLWSRFVQAVRPRGGYPAFVPPPGIVAATIDPGTGQIATPYCPASATELFPEWQAPSEPCHRHGPGGTTVWADSGTGGQLVDPVTGEPLYDYSANYPYNPGLYEGDAYAAGEEGSIEIGPSAGYAEDPWLTDPAQLDPAADPAAEPQPALRPIRPIDIQRRPIEPVDAPANPADTPEATRILIQPTQGQRGAVTAPPVPPAAVEPVPAPPAAEPEPVAIPEEENPEPPPGW
ncbi:MAG TPA: PBP1A family penicillin-binding protein, partial [Thermoanaerobaculia bacterium]|nr:PBP1A family penicillin-binding protein [Thermoanaerobaculia bacterium]